MISSKCGCILQGNKHMGNEKIVNEECTKYYP